ncbi:PilN domain-containing protein [Paenibacillus koleovorans]|uniref:PilN domain-containing protein n=1 Tax=Paenibacillus koleovorans TaxID=121608 RepID=UPI000FD7DF55|nr:hypothetical protein [Paenibacillus koleovorans]
MNSINLLPKVKPIDRYFIPLLILIIAATAAVALVFVYWTLQTGQKTSDERGHVAQLEQRIAELRTLLKVDPTTQAYLSLEAEVNKLLAGRRDWQQILNGVTGPLPITSRLLRFGSDDGENIKITLEANQMNDVAQYVSLLESTQLFPVVTVISVKQKSFSRPAGSASIGSFPVTTPLISSNEVVILYEAEIQLKLKTIPGEKQVAP